MTGTPLLNPGFPALKDRRAFSRAHTLRRGHARNKQSEDYARPPCKTGGARERRNSGAGWERDPEARHVPDDNRWRGLITMGVATADTGVHTSRGAVMEHVEKIVE